jgi:hypothetical protein
MTKDEALDLALEALEYIHEGANNQGPHTGISWRCVAVKADRAITAIKQARALDKKAENARELGLDYEPHKGLSEHMAQATNGRVRIDPVTGDVGIGTPPVQPAVPDALFRHAPEHPQYIEGWNDCRAEMMKGMK